MWSTSASCVSWHLSEVVSVAEAEHFGHWSRYLTLTGVERIVTSLAGLPASAQACMCACMCRSSCPGPVWWHHGWQAQLCYWGLLRDRVELCLRRLANV